MGKQAQRGWLRMVTCLRLRQEPCCKPVVKLPPCPAGSLAVLFLLSLVPRQRKCCPSLVCHD